MKFVTFTGEETEKEFLEKCLEQWDMSSQESPLQAVMQLGAMFSEMRHRVNELDEKDVLVFNGSDFVKPSEAFQKEWGIKKLEVGFSESGEIEAQAVERYGSAACIHWSWNEDEESDVTCEEL